MFSLFVVQLITSCASVLSFLGIVIYLITLLVCGFFIYFYFACGVLFLFHVFTTVMIL